MAYLAPKVASIRAKPRLSDDPAILKLFDEFPEILSPSFDSETIAHGVQHFIPQFTPSSSKARNWRRQRLRSMKWRRWAYCGARAARGRLLYKWSGRQMAGGAHAATTAP